MKEKALKIFVLIIFLVSPMLEHEAKADTNSWGKYEQQLLARSDKVAWREGEALNLKLLDGRTVQLANVPYDPKTYGADAVTYRLVGHVVPIEYFVLGLSYHAGNGAMVVDRKTGERAVIDDMPNFSPDQSLFFSADFTEEFFSKSRIQIWRTTPSGPLFEWEFKPARQWSGVEIKWVDNTHIHVFRMEHRRSKYGESGILPRETTFAFTPPKGWTIHEFPTLETR